MAKLDFLMRTLSAYWGRQDKVCPRCSSESVFLGRKHYVLELRRCTKCNLMFRWPKESTGFNRMFYQSRYVEKGLTTDLPTAEQLSQLLSTAFAGSEKDYSDKISVVKELLPSGRVLDFGCSWGYATLQLKLAGYETDGFEISKPRAAYGRAHLGVNIIDEYEKIDSAPDGSYDLIFSSHVLEHIPTLGGVFERFNRLLRKDGFLVIFVPNCGGANARAQGAKWGAMIGEKHPLALDALFFKTVLPQFGFSLSAWSNPYHPDQIGSWVAGKPVSPNMDGSELLICARKNRSL